MGCRKKNEVTRKIPTDNSKSVESACKSIYWFNGNLIFLPLVQIYKRGAILLKDSKVTKEMCLSVQENQKIYNAQILTRGGGETFKRKEG